MRILVPQPGMEPVPPAVEAQSLTHWTAREVPSWFSWGSSAASVSGGTTPCPTHTSLHGKTGRDRAWEVKRNRAGSRW